MLQLHFIDPTCMILQSNLFIQNVDTLAQTLSFSLVIFKNDSLVCYQTVYQTTIDLRTTFLTGDFALISSFSVC